MSAVTIATASGGIATKQRRQTLAGLIVTDYPNEKWWKFREVSVPSDAEGWADFLSDQVNDFASCCLYGKPINPSGGFQRRLLHPTDTDPASLHEVTRDYLVVDLDSVPAPAGHNFITDPAGTIGAVLDGIEELRGCAFAAAISCSAGFKPGVRAKVIVPLDQPLLPSEMRRYAKHVNARAGAKLLDPAVLAPAQPIYLARPILHGTPDPFPQRVHMRQGSRPVVMAPSEIVGAKHVEAATTGGSGWRAHLARLGPLGFHETLLTAAGSVVRSYCGPPTEPIASAIHAIVRMAVLSADPGGRSQAEIARYASRRFWDDAVAHAAGRESNRLRRISASVAGIRRA